METRKMIAMAVMTILIVCAGFSVWAVPGIINNQGRLTDANGDPLNGTYTMTFKIYDDDIGGTLLWTESQSVQVTNGIYDVQLGATATIAPDIFANDTLYIGVTILNPDTQANEILTPRQQLTSSPYAIRAEVADSVANGAVTTDMLSDDAITSAKIMDGVITGSDLQNGAALTEILDNDGAGSGLDSDKLDGIDASAFLTGETDPQVGANISNYIPKWNGAALVTGSLTDNNGVVGLEKDGGKLILRTPTRNHPSRMGFRFENNVTGYFEGDGTQIQTYDFYSLFSAARTYDASLKVHGRAANSWGQYIELTHDGTNGLINADSGNIILNQSTGVGTTTPQGKFHGKATSGALTLREGIIAKGDAAPFAGVYGYGNGSDYGVYGKSASGFAGGFDGGVTISAAGWTYPNLKLSDKNNNALYTQILQASDGLLFRAFYTPAAGYPVFSFRNLNDAYIMEMFPSQDTQFYGNVHSTKMISAKNEYGDMVRLGGDSAGSDSEITLWAPAERNRLSLYNATIAQGIDLGCRDAYVKTLHINSDERLKENIVPIEKALEDVLKLQGVTFSWKQGENSAAGVKRGREIGLIAQDVEKVLPELVSTDNVTGYKTVEYPNLVAVLIEAVKELKVQNEELKERIEALEMRE